MNQSKSTIPIIANRHVSCLFLRNKGQQSLEKQAKATAPRCATLRCRFRREIRPPVRRRAGRAMSHAPAAVSVSGRLVGIRRVRRVAMAPSPARQLDGSPAAAAANFDRPLPSLTATLYGVATGRRACTGLLASFIALPCRLICI